MSRDANESGQSTDARPVKMREINFQHSAQFVPILQHLGCSLLISTYAAGKVVAVGTGDDGLRLGFSNFQQAMGIATGSRGLAVGGPNLIWMLRPGGPLAAQMDPVGRHDEVYLARESFVTGNISVHEMAWGGTGELWVVNTLFSCLCTLHEDFNFVPRWQPPFITDLAAEDRCHMNGMLMENGQPKYVSALGTSNEARGWRGNKVDGGVLMDVESGEVVARGFCMPHSPRLHDGKVYMLDSGRGHLVTVDIVSGKSTVITDYPGYGRGMAIHGQFAFIGMSKARETSVFGGVPICEDRSKMRCGIAVVDLLNGKAVAFLEFQSGVEELFAVNVLPNIKSPVISGPYPAEDGQPPVWVVPKPSQVKGLVEKSGRGTVTR